MQAIILAAGMGKRLKELTADETKCMIKVNGITLIERALSQLETLDLSKIIIVVGYKGDKLINFIQTLPFSTPIEFVTNPIYDTTNNIYSLYLARDLMLKEDTLLLESDLIFNDTVLTQLVEDPYPNLALVAKYESWMDGTVITIDEQNNITDFLNKAQFKFCDRETYYKTVNIYKFSKEFSRSHYVPFLEAYCKALGTNEYYEQVLKVIALLENPGIKAKVLNNNEVWYEIDDKPDLDIAESLFTETTAERLEKLNKRYGGYWRYPKLLDFCYLVNPYYPPQKMVDEIGANLNRLLCDYPSGQEVNALLAADYFGVPKEMIVVGNGAAELIKSITNTISGNIGIITPTFEEYPNRIPAERIISFTPFRDGYTYTVDDITNYFSDKNISTLVVINPDNPSGNFIAKKELIRLLEWSAQGDVQLVVDESFIDFSDTGDQESLITKELLTQYPLLIIVKSISKSYGVPGIRLGIVCSGNKELISFIKRDVSIWNINSIAEFYLQICSKYRSDYSSALTLFREARKTFFDKLQALPHIRPIESQANYIMCEVLDPFTAAQVTMSLLEKDILIKDLSTKPGIEGEYIRVAVKREDENDLLIKALQEMNR